MGGERLRKVQAKETTAQVENLTFPVGRRAIPSLRSRLKLPRLRPPVGGKFFKIGNKIFHFYFFCLTQAEGYKPCLILNQILKNFPAKQATFSTKQAKLPTKQAPNL